MKKVPAKRTFQINDINIGDHVLLKNNRQVHHNLFWRVVNKLSNNRLLIEIREMGYAEKFTVSIKDVTNLQRDSISFCKLNFLKGSAPALSAYVSNS